MPDCIDNGGPAFPVDQTYELNGVQHRLVSDGMTLRDYFAAHVAVPADLTRVWGEMMVRKYPTRPNSNEDAYFGPEVILWWADVEAAYRYIYADAMLRARKGGAA